MKNAAVASWVHLGAGPSGGRGQVKGRRHTHLCQSRLLVADFVLADGRQLLQRVAVVGERPRQASELGPSCRDQTPDTAFR